MVSSKVNIDFSIYSTLYTLGVCDLSDWALIVNEPAIIEINLPGYEQPITKYFDKGQLNVFNSTLLQINCPGDCGDSERLPLPDGIYKVKIIGSPSTFNKTYYYLKTDAFDMDFDHMFIKNFKFKDRPDFINKITEIEMLIKGAHSFLRQDLVNHAGELFQKARELVEDMSNCSNC